MASLLSQDSIAERLGQLDGWRAETVDRAIAKEFVFKDFSEAFAFMTRAAMEAEKMDHHPEWSNVYKTVKVRLTTHDAGGVTDLDLKLAAAMDRFARHG